MLLSMKTSLAVVLAFAFGQAEPPFGVRRSSGRFEFRYPAAFGDPLPGTNNGFGDRVAAIRFSLLAPSRVGSVAKQR
jgi:hypothetical protein